LTVAPGSVTPETSTSSWFRYSGRSVIFGGGGGVVSSLTTAEPLLLMPISIWANLATIGNPNTAKKLQLK